MLCEIMELFPSHHIHKAYLQYALAQQKAWKITQ